MLFQLHWNIIDKRWFCIFKVCSIAMCTFLPMYPCTDNAKWLPNASYSTHIHLVVVSFCVWMCAVRRILSYFLSKFHAYTRLQLFDLWSLLIVYVKVGTLRPCPPVSSTLPFLSSLFVAPTIPLSAPVSSTCLDSTCPWAHAAPMFLCAVYSTCSYVLCAHPHCRR